MFQQSNAQRRNYPWILTTQKSQNWWQTSTQLIGTTQNSQYRCCWYRRFWSHRTISSRRCNHKSNLDSSSCQKSCLLQNYWWINRIRIEKLWSISRRKEEERDSSCSMERSRLISKRRTHRINLRSSFCQFRQKNSRKSQRLRFNLSWCQIIFRQGRNRQKSKKNHQFVWGMRCWYKQSFD